jgi:uncharacterized protein (DUF433 family)
MVILNPAARRHSVAAGFYFCITVRVAMETNADNVQPTTYPHIVKVPGVCGGAAILAGTRIAVWQLVGYYYKTGMSVEDILAEWDYLTPAQIFSALAYYHDHKPEIDALRAQNAYPESAQEPQSYAA